MGVGVVSLILAGSGGFPVPIPVLVPVLILCFSSLMWHFRGVGIVRHTKHK